MRRWWIWSWTPTFRIPTIRNESQKLDIYKRIAGIESAEECEDMQDELLDRFGDLPKPVLNLLAVADLKVKAHRVYVKELVERPDEIRILLYEKARLNPAAFVDFIAGFGGQHEVREGGKAGLLLPQAEKQPWEGRRRHGAVRRDPE